MLVPFFTFSTCFLGVLLIRLSLNICNNWSRSFRINNFVLLDDYFELFKVNGIMRFNLVFKIVDNMFHYLLPYSYLPVVFNSALSRIEFKIFYSIFCESFRLKLTSFAFDSYAEIIFEKFIIELIHIDIVNWMFFGAALCLQWLRLDFTISVKNAIYLHFSLHDLLLVVDIFYAVISKFTFIYVKNIYLISFNLLIV